VCLDVRVLCPRIARRRLTLDSAAYTESIRQGLQEYAITPDHCAAFIADHAPPLRKALRDMTFGVLGCGCHGLQLQPRQVLPEVGRNGVFRGKGENDACADSSSSRASSSSSSSSSSDHDGAVEQPEGHEEWDEQDPPVRDHQIERASIQAEFG
jgi:hypothetical protein